MGQQTQSLSPGAGKIARSIRKREPLEVRNGKSYFPTDKSGVVVQDFGLVASLETTDIPAASRELAVLRNEISSYLFEYLDGFRIATHYVSRLSETEMLVRKVEAIPLRVKVYNTETGALVKRLAFGREAQLDYPIIEHYYCDVGNSSRNSATWVNEYHLYAYGLATPEEYRQINRLATKTNAVLRGLCERRDLTLLEMQLEFGRCNGQIVVADELSHVTCHFLDIAPTASKGSSDRRHRYAPSAGADAATIAALRDRLKLKV